MSLFSFDVYFFTDRQTDRQNNRQAGRETDRQIDRRKKTSNQQKENKISNEEINTDTYSKRQRDRDSRGRHIQSIQLIFNLDNKGSSGFKLFAAFFKLSNTPNIQHYLNRYGGDKSLWEVLCFFGTWLTVLSSSGNIWHILAISIDRYIYCMIHHGDHHLYLY